jgi:hypothetical protein
MVSPVLAGNMGEAGSRFPVNLAASNAQVKIDMFPRKARTLMLPDTK